MISCLWHSMILSLQEANKNLTCLGYILVGNVLSGNNMANFHIRGDTRNYTHSVECSIPILSSDIVNHVVCRILDESWRVI